MTHFIRDLQITPKYSPTGGSPQTNLVMYHFLRNCGWEQIWECDGNTSALNPTHIVDGNMETAGVGAWSDVGTPTVKEKVTIPILMGEHALHVEANAAAEGVRSTLLASMQNSSEYHIDLWAYNPDEVWEVWVDDGSGVPAKLGDIPVNASYTKYSYEFTTNGGGNRYLYIQSGVAAVSEIYVDGVIVYRGFFEYCPMENGIAGRVQNNNEFIIEAPDTYSLVLGDIGKYVFLYDPVNTENSGVYVITNVAAGVATLDLRSATGVLTTTGGLRWRLIDVTTDDPEDGTTNPAYGWCGWGLQSPHTSKWRFFYRQNISGAAKGICVWCSPEDTDFDYETGLFLKNGPSTMRDTASVGASIVGVTASIPGVFSYFAAQSHASLQRVFFRVEDDFSSLSLVQIDTYVSPSHGCLIAGFVTSDSDYPGAEGFVLCTKFETQNASDMISFLGSFGVSQTFAGVIATFGSSGIASKGTIASPGFGATSDDVTDQTNAQNNPYDATPWLFPLVVFRDADFMKAETGVFEMDHYFMTRENIPSLSTFDSNSYLTFTVGLVWDWNGFDLV